MKIGVFQFSPGFWPSVLFIGFFPLFLALGFWQLERAKEKRAILDEIDEKLRAYPVAIEKIDEVEDVFVSVLLRGHFLGDRQILLDNKVNKGTAGYEVLTPFRLNSNGRLVMVNRGWVPLGLSRQRLPDVSLAEAVPSEISGIYTHPSSGFSLGDAVDPGQTGWPRILQYIDYPRIEELLGESVLPGVVQIDHNVDANYPKIWQPVVYGPEKHYGYALQWFSVALILFILYTVLNTKKLKK